MGRRRPLMPPPPRLVLFVSLATSVKGMSRADGGADAPLALMAPEKVGMRVMSFNARLDTTQPDGTDGADGSDAWPHRRELLLADITARNPDLLGLQEVLPHMAAWLCERLPGYAFVNRGRLPLAAGSSTELMSLAGSNESTLIFFRKSRFSSLGSGQIWLSDTPGVPGSRGPDFRHPRIATWVRLRDSFGTAPGDGTLLFMNTQLDDGADSTQLFGARVILKFLEEERASRVQPVILTGDMNCHDDSAAYAALRSGTGTDPLVDTHREVHPEPDEMEETSHPGWFSKLAQHGGPRTGERPTSPFGQRIDYIFASASGFKVVDAGIDRFEDKTAATSEGSGLGEADGGGRFGRGRFPSDHFAVLSTLEYA
jgi:endonuclease/exonuclease/phosphatase family metal-dependent hydrolase